MTPNVPTKHLLVLCYVLIEGTKSRYELANFFWPHLSGRYTKKGERKDLSNLGVARAVLRRELNLNIEDSTQLTAFVSDLKQFEKAMEDEAFEDALTWYHRGLFLEGIEEKGRLNLSSELYTWLETKRTQLATLAQHALLQLARVPDDAQKALAYTEEAFYLNASRNNLELMGQLYKLLTTLDSPLKLEALETFTTLIEEHFDLISPEALRLYLALSLQETSNLAAAQVAANLSPKAGASCLKELITTRLISNTHKVLSQEVSAYYFREHPQEKMYLLNRLCDNTPAEQTFELYQAIYDLGQTFGGIGYWSKAREAYCYKAITLIQANDFQRAAKVLAQFEIAERDNQQTPHPDNRFLQAYALERLRNYNRALEVLEDVEPSLEVLALRAALLASTNNFKDARILAQQVNSENVKGSKPFWARAIALNTLGKIAYEENSFLEAEVCFARASIQWALAGHPQRELGALMNRANCLEDLGRSAEAKRVYEELLDKCDNDNVLRVRTLLNLGYLHEEAETWQEAYALYDQAFTLCETKQLEQLDMALVAAVYNNLGHAAWKLGNTKARTYLKQALKLSLKAGERFWYAIALSNLSLIDEDIGQFGVALDLFKHLGSQREYSYYGKLYQEMLERAIEAAKINGDNKGLSFLEEVLKTFSDQHDNVSIKETIN